MARHGLTTRSLTRNRAWHTAHVAKESSSGRFLPEDFGIGRLFRHVRDAVVVANAATERVVLWNDYAASLFGYSEDEALKLPLHALVPEDLRAVHRTGLANYQATGEGNLIGSGCPAELVALRKDGADLPIELTLTPIPETTSEGHRFALAIIRDISERKAAELANSKLREAAADRRRALELNDVIVQGLATAKLALESGQHEVGIRSVSDTLQNAKALVNKLLQQMEDSEGPLQPGDLVRGRELEGKDIPSK